MIKALSKDAVPVMAGSQFYELLNWISDIRSVFQCEYGT